MEILKSLSFGPRQSNEVAAYTFLALLDLEANAPWSAAGEHYLDDVIRPADTRAVLTRSLELAQRANGGFGQRRLAHWPPCF